MRAGGKQKTRGGYDLQRVLGEDTIFPQLGGNAKTEFTMEVHLS